MAKRRSWTLRAAHVFVHFFATWCEPCREELPALIVWRHASDADVPSLAIGSPKPTSACSSFFAETPVGFPVLLDGSRRREFLERVSALPTTFVLDANLSRRFVVDIDFAWDTII